jgi:hypothetical protein
VGLAFVVELDRASLFVDVAVVAAAERDQVVEIGLAAVAPVLDVVAVDEPRVGAAGETAAAVARAEGASQRR